jgi:hypothetical protein
MADDNRSNPREVSGPDQLKDLHSPTRPTPQSRPPVFNDGLESPRSGHC